MNLSGLGVVGTLVLGTTVGFLMSLPPGPGVTQVLGFSFQGRKKLAWKAALGLLAADSLIILFCLIFYSFISGLSENKWVHLVGGIFLIAFALKNLVAKSTVIKEPSISPFRYNFRLTFLNPNIWLALITLAALAFENVSTGISLMIGVEIGALVWFSILIYFANRIPTSRHILIQRYAMIFIACMGLYVVTNALRMVA